MSVTRATIARVGSRRAFAFTFAATAVLNNRTVLTPRLGARRASLGLASSPMLLNHATPHDGVAAAPRRSPFVVGVTRLAARGGEGQSRRSRRATSRRTQTFSSTKESRPSRFGASRVDNETRAGKGGSGAPRAYLGSNSLTCVNSIPWSSCHPTDFGPSATTTMLSSDTPDCGALIYPPSFVFLRSRLPSCFGSAREPWSRSERRHARELERNAFRRGARSAAIGLARGRRASSSTRRCPSRTPSGLGP